MELTRSYIVPKPPAELLSRLGKDIDENDALAWLSFSDRPEGTISGDWFEFKLRTGMNGSYKPVLEGKVTPCPEGSLVRGRVGVERFAPVVMKLWLAGTMGFQVLFLLAFLAGSPTFKGWIVVAPTGMAICGLALYRLNKMLSEPEASKLLKVADGFWGPAKAD